VPLEHDGLDLRDSWHSVIQIGFPRDPLETTHSRRSTAMHRQTALVSLVALSLLCLLVLPASAADLRSQNERIISATTVEAAIAARISQPQRKAPVPVLQPICERSSKCIPLPSNTAPEPAPEPDPELFAYDLFEPEWETEPDDFSLVNSFLLASASFYVYEPIDFDGTDFEAHFRREMKGFGLHVLRYIDNPSTNTQGAVLSNDEVVIVAFRGTTPGQDFWTDLSTALLPAPENWGEGALVHAGFQGAFESVIDEVKIEVEQEKAKGKTLWITGHSLGGAIATLTATWFQANGIDVEGVHTFGSPRVGNNFFAAGYAQLGLQERSWRWILEADPIPAFVANGPYLSCAFVFCNLSNIAYQHVGIPNNIFRSGSLPEFDYSLELEALVPIQASLCSSWLCTGSMVGANVEHVKYDNALNAFLDEEFSDELMNVMPPLSLDTY
jgi:hypothetical protein